jgi:hypothetical protein
MGFPNRKPAGAFTSAGNKRQSLRPVGGTLPQISCDLVTASAFWHVQPTAAGCAFEIGDGAS